MESAILSTEIFGMLMLAVIVYGVCFETKEKNEKSNTFLILVTSVFVTLAIDAASYLPLDWENLYSFQFALTLASFVAPFIAYAIFMQYLYLHISTRTNVSHTWFKIGISFCVCLCIICCIYGYQGYLFVIENGVYSPGEYYSVYLISYLILLGYNLLVVIINIKQMGIHDALAALVFMFIPLIFLVLNLLLPELSFSVPSLAISMLIINVTLQGEHVNKLVESEVESSRLAHCDELTGLLNRLAFNENCDKLSSEEPLGVIFSDLNGLKYTNDNFGHKAGDALLCDYAQLLLSCFRKDDVFRISGDEFVILLPDMPKEIFEKKIADLQDKINSKEVPIAAFGFAYGTKSEAKKLISLSENDMYEDKKIFHDKYPQYNRTE